MRNARAPRLKSRVGPAGLLFSLLAGASGAAGEGSPSNGVGQLIGASSMSGQCSVGGAILARYGQLGGRSGSLGVCLSGELPTPEGRGRYSVFENGAIYWTVVTGAHEVRGAILAEWVRLGGPGGRLGYPLTGEYDVAHGRQSTFEGGSLHFDAKLGQTVVIAPPVTPTGVPDSSTFFATVDIDEKTTLPVLGDGDLWPSCWSDDGALYTANGDGRGIDHGARDRADLAVSRVDGEVPGPLTGVVLAQGDQVARVWSAADHNRKPTGMACVGGDIYLAVQDLTLDFEAAPALSISRSIDKGRTWTWDPAAPIFGGSIFTTVMFLDAGRDSGATGQRFVYAYGIDHNWRFSSRVPDPTVLYLARVPADRVQQRAAWQFYMGSDPSGDPSWTHDIHLRQPVLEDRSLAFPKMLAKFPEWPGPMTKVAQGGVFYNAPLKRYIYTSWTRLSWEFYEAPQPWGPWRHFVSKNFGVYPWTESKHGGYAPTAPTKYLSADGKRFYVQANTFLSGVGRYGFALREVRLEPYVPASAVNERGSASLAAPDLGTTVLSYSNHFGRSDLLNDGLVVEQSEDSWNGEAKSEDFWGYTWPRPYNLNRVAYTTGKVTSEGGWFEPQPRVQVRQNGLWLDVASACTTPPYLGRGVGSHATYITTFGDTWGDGVRIVGRPGGAGHFTSVAELDASYTAATRSCAR